MLFAARRMIRSASSSALRRLKGGRRQGRSRLPPRGNMLAKRHELMHDWERFCAGLNRRGPKQMDLLLGIIAWLLTLAIAAIFWLFGKKIHFDVIEEMPVFFIVMIVGFPLLAGLYGGLALFAYNVICSRLSLPELSLPWWPQKVGEPAVVISWYVYTAVLALYWFYPRR